MATKKSLGRLEKIELRDVWESEPADFTPWLAKEENLRLLGGAIGIELELESQEKNVGPFKADILCKDTATDTWVLIENQLERTDHTHLGQLLTYGAGLDAITIVWIAHRFADEHRAALDWLNERTDESINLFGLEIELWKIGNSPVAPKFNIISKPNKWSRTIKQAANTGDTTDHKQMQLKYWIAFKEYMEQRDSSLHCRQPQPTHWMSFGLGRVGIKINAIISSWDWDSGMKGSEIRAELYLYGPKAKQLYSILEKRKRKLSAALGFNMIWYNPEDKAACRIIVKQDYDFQNEESWPKQFEWLRKKLEILYKVFSPIIQDLKIGELE